MDNNYWKEYWDSYYKFMDFYINKLQNIYPSEDIEERYTEVAKQFEPSIRPKGYIPPVIRPGGQWPCPGTQQGNQGQGMGQGLGQGTQQGNQGQGMGQGAGQGTQQGLQGPGPAISPGGGQFTLNNCRKMAIVRVVMRGGFNPSNFYMVVENADRRSIQGYRIDCNQGRIRFVSMSVEYRNINFIECVF